MFNLIIFKILSGLIDLLKKQSFLKIDGNSEIRKYISIHQSSQLKEQNSM